MPEVNHKTRPLAENTRQAVFFFGASATDGNGGARKFVSEKGNQIFWGAMCAIHYTSQWPMAKVPRRERRLLRAYSVGRKGGLHSDSVINLKERRTRRAKP